MIISVDHVKPLSSIRALLPLPALAQCVYCDLDAHYCVVRSTLYRVHWWSISRHKLVALCLVPQLLIISITICIGICGGKATSALAIVAAEFLLSRVEPLVFCEASVLSC